MHKPGEHLCSDLVSLRLSTGEAVVGHLEKISASGCEITLDGRVAADSVVALQCVECPKGDARCIQCRMTGVVRSQENDPPLGVLVAVEFRMALGVRSDGSLGIWLIWTHSHQKFH